MCYEPFLVQTFTRNDFCMLAIRRHSLQIKYTGKVIKIRLKAPVSSMVEIELL